ncbi:hypothetical protein [Chitinophaga pinensis]|uniref:Glycosyltransferase RgtA/B/C/D-like domain-containing protein n=1 Tax=Chitinophaga pinensis (strain ATCC 43595 / DSM 2588 / LMG 13176 / NBRC 15968 / NCIMB 11800 / UQM 2034) TaxID=485918 RepID=A0A979GB70_CHIPD|nr:hypothetical protein [Chitinophaga pinensis]ACU64051.1 hypothetical protein Cpin_6647 [Chitinophaga pinensis DSM 2588]
MKTYTLYISYLRKDKLVFLLLALLTLCVYAHIRSLNFQTNWDDQWVVQNWYTEGGFSMINFRSILTDFYEGQYSPVNQFYYTLIYAAFGYNSIAFHIAGLIVHLLNAWVIYKFMSKFLTMSAMVPVEEIRFVSIGTICLFLIHPFNVESVVWLSASKVMLYSLFYFLGLYCYLLYAEQHKRSYFILTLLCFVTSFWAKEQALVFPLTLILIDFFIYQRKEAVKRLREKIPFLLMTVFFGVITILSQFNNMQGVLTPKVQFPLYQRICFGGYALCEYFIKCVIPIKLSYIYPFPNLVTEKMSPIYWSYPLAIILLIIFVMRYSKSRILQWGVIFFIINLLVVLHIIPMSRFSIIADRYVYVSSVAVFALIAHFAYQLLFSTKYSNARKVIVPACMLYFGYLCLYTNQRVQVWENSHVLKKELKTILKNRKDLPVEQLE